MKQEKTFEGGSCVQKRRRFSSFLFRLSVSDNREKYVVRRYEGSNSVNIEV